MNGLGFNKVRNLIEEIAGLESYITDIEPVEGLTKTYGHNGGINFSVLLPNNTFSKFVIRYRQLDETFTVEVSKYNSFSYDYESAIVKEDGLVGIFKTVYEEISLLNNLLLDRLSFKLTGEAKKDLKRLIELDKYN